MEKHLGERIKIETTMKTLKSYAGFLGLLFFFLITEVPLAYWFFSKEYDNNYAGAVFSISVGPLVLGGWLIFFLLFFIMGLIQEEQRLLYMLMCFWMILFPLLYIFVNGFS
ncbi:MAG: hypothetical protein AAGD28_32210 [Bacteroidota bacterium]